MLSTLVWQFCRKMLQCSLSWNESPCVWTEEWCSDEYGLVSPVFVSAVTGSLWAMTLPYSLTAINILDVLKTLDPPWRSVFHGKIWTLISQKTVPACLMKLTGDCQYGLLLPTHNRRRWTFAPGEPELSLVNIASASGDVSDYKICRRVYSFCQWIGHFYKGSIHACQNSVY